MTLVVIVFSLILHSNLFLTQHSRTDTITVFLINIFFRFKKKASKNTEEDFGKPYQSHSLGKPPLSYSNSYSSWVKEPNASLPNSGAPRIPRATISNNWERKTNLVMTPVNNRKNLISSGRYSVGTDLN